MRWLLFAAVAVSLSGCGIPPIISVASLVFDFASYGATGKTVADHGLSAVLQRDCALLRGLEGQVCVAQGSAEASTKPLKEAETRASLRVALLEEESNRATVHYSTGRDARVTLQSTFATDPSITPNPIPARTRGQAEWARRQLSGIGYLSQGIVPERETSG